MYITKRNILLLWFILFFLTIICYRFAIETFINDPGVFDENGIEKNRTKLYGSLFLDKLNEHVKNLTDPKIMYNSKQINIIKYSDVLQNST
jgi:hypothetical protein